MSLTKSTEATYSSFIPPTDPIRAAAEALLRALAGQPAVPDEEVALDLELAGFRLVCWRRSGTSSPSLSPREQEISRLIAAGHPNKVIADILEISEWTVCTHLRRMFAKLQVSSRAALVAKLAHPGGQTHT